MMGEGQYAVGIEPCTSGFDRAQVEAAGDMIWLEPGDVREYDLEVGILDGGGRDLRPFSECEDRWVVAHALRLRDAVEADKRMPDDTYGHTPYHEGVRAGRRLWRGVR